MMFRDYQSAQVPILPPDAEAIRQEKEAQLDVVRRLRRKLARTREKSMPIFLTSPAVPKDAPPP